MKVHSHDEFSQLKSVILGTFSKESAALETQNPSASFTEARLLIQKAYPDWYIDEVNEDIEGFRQALVKSGVEVYRPSWPFPSSYFASPNWACEGYDIYNVRDNHIVFGDKIVSSPPSSRFRQNEHFAYYSLFHQLQINYKANWIYAPRPSLQPGFSLPLNKTPTKLELVEEARHSKLSGGLKEHHTYLYDDEIIFDAANIIRIGVDILYLVSSTGNLSGYRWLKNTLGGKYRVHLTNTYRSSHLDSTICPLRPGLVLLNADRVDTSTIPTIFDNWDKIFFSNVSPIPSYEIEFYQNVRKPVAEQLNKLGFSSPIEHISSPWGGLNVFSISPTMVCVEASQLALINILEKHGLTVIPIEYRHFYTMLGCLHCSTLDLHRDSELIDYCA